MATTTRVHNLDIYPCTGARSCIGCVSVHKDDSSPVADPPLPPASPAELSYLARGTWSAPVRSVATAPEPPAAVQLDFLDVTSIVRSKAGGRRLGTGVAEYDAASPRFGANPHYGCQLRVLEYVGKTPRAWLVLSPPAALREKRKRQFLLFFGSAAQKETARLDDVLDADMGKFNRYFPDTDRREPPWFIARTGTGWKWHGGPRCGFERQLVESGRAVHVVAPLPHWGEYGAAVTRWPEALDGIARALVAQGVLDPRRTEPRFDRVGLMGASYGGHMALEAWKRHRDRVDELVLCDAKNLGRYDGPGQLPAWIDSSKRLRMFGGHYQRAAMRGLAAGRAPVATVLPADDGYWHTSPVYQAALSEPEGDGPVLTPAEEEPPPGSVSARSGFRFLEMEGDTHLWLAVHDEAGERLGKLKVQGGTREVAAVLAYAFVEYARIDTDAGRAIPPAAARGGVEPPRTLAQARVILDRAWSIAQRIRHKWAVVGGEGDEDRGRSFRGVLRLALDASMFA